MKNTIFGSGAKVHIGLDAKLIIPEYPASHFVGKAVHFAGSQAPAWEPRF